MLVDHVLALLQKQDGLSDREITDSLFGKEFAPQSINQACHKLRSRGLIYRQKRSDGPLRNYLSKDSAALPSVLKNQIQPSFTVEVPEELRHKASELGALWAASDMRPRVKNSVQEQWDRLIDDWIAAKDLPLALRKQAQSYARGSVVTHTETGREIIWTDNSPAQWAFFSAWRSIQYSLDNVRELLASNKIPFAFASKRSDNNVKHRGTVGNCKVDLSKLGWKLCHIKRVSINARTIPQELAVHKLEEHFALLMKPSNHFVVPKQWSGFGEIPEVIHEISRYEQTRLSNPQSLSD